MKIQRKSPVTGVDHEMDIAVTLEQLMSWQNGMLIRKAMPNLTPEEREFIISGITKEEWDQLYPEEE